MLVLQRQFCYPRILSHFFLIFTNFANASSFYLMLLLKILANSETFCTLLDSIGVKGQIIGVLGVSF